MQSSYYMTVYILWLIIVYSKSKMTIDAENPQFFIKTTCYSNRTLYIFSFCALLIYSNQIHVCLVRTWLLTLLDVTRYALIRLINVELVNLKCDKRRIQTVVKLWNGITCKIHVIIYRYTQSLFILFSMIMLLCFHEEPFKMSFQLFLPTKIHFNEHLLNLFQSKMEYVLLHYPIPENLTFDR